MEITDLLQADENVFELRVTNTLVNLLEATQRPSGLTGAPRLVPYRQFVFNLANHKDIAAAVAQDTEG